jgi:hypothetical protein
MITTDKIRTVLAAFDKDRAIRYRPLGSSNPWKMTGNPSWDFLSTAYSPVPQPRVWFLNVYPDGVLTRAGNAYNTKTEADFNACSDRVECIRVREILEGD